MRRFTAVQKCDLIINEKSSQERSLHLEDEVNKNNTDIFCLPDHSSGEIELINIEDYSLEYYLCKYYLKNGVVYLV